MDDDALEPRLNVPDADVVADSLIDDMRQEDSAAAFLDAVGTLTGLTEDDLVSVAINLARRIAKS